ncbi:hypothetical protein SAMN05444337_1921 [Flavobacterium haoranii]|uniref:Uncharacterized protein n=2 Tax=Flavobacterium haoranii TaxID=683124 RepID=A0A1M6IZM3_9FLAO|nr:hypothetical protein SAMN05444337_1921 [Flavobacterium haoranii]
MIKKYTIFFLIVFILLQTVGMFYFATVSHKIFKKIAESNKNPHLVVTKTISKKDYFAMKIADHEIVMDEELYDILEETFVGDFIKLKLYKDKKEKNFALKIKNIQKKNQSSKSKSIFKTKIACLEQTKYFISKSTKNESLKKMPFSFIHIKEIYLSIIVPPPELV